MENHHPQLVLSTISMAIFNSYVSHYQRVQGPGEDSRNEIARARARDSNSYAREIVQGLCGGELRWN